MDSIKSPVVRQESKDSFLHCSVDQPENEAAVGRQEPAGRQEPDASPLPMSMPMVLQRRRVRDLESWVLFVDPGQAYDKEMDGANVIGLIKEGLQLVLAPNISKDGYKNGEKKSEVDENLKRNRPVVSWECDTDMGTSPYSKDISATIEDGYYRWTSSDDLSLGVVPFVRDGISYEIDFTCSPMTQRNQEFDTTRVVRRKVVGLTGRGDDRLHQFLRLVDHAAHCIPHPAHGYATTPVHQLFNEHTWYHYRGEGHTSPDVFGPDLVAPFDDTPSVIRAIRAVHNKDSEALMFTDE